MKITTFKTVAITLVVLVVWESFALVYPHASFANSNISIHHTPPTCIASGHPYPLSVTMTAPDAIRDVRVYFKIEEAPAYYFVHMTSTHDQTYVGILPAAAKAGRVVEYFIATYDAAMQTSQSPRFYTLTQKSTECPPVEIPEERQSIVVYADQAIAPEIGFTGDLVQWKTTRAFEDAPMLAATKSNLRPITIAQEVSDTEEKPSVFNLLDLPPKALLGIGLGIGAVAVGIAVLTQEESTINWTLDPDDLDKKIKAEIIKTPNVQTTCGTVVNNDLYVTNKLSHSLTVTSIDYEVVLTRDKPSGSCDPGRIGTFAPNWAVIVAPGERALVRQWSNEVNPCSACPYTSSKCKWASKYVVHTTLGSGETETDFATEGDLCSASLPKSLTSCTPPGADVEP